MSFKLEILVGKILRLACKTLSKIDDFSCPRIEICLWVLFFRPRIGDNIEQWHGKGFSDHFLHHEIWLQKIGDILGWPLNVTLVCD